VAFILSLIALTFFATYAVLASEDSNVMHSSGSVIYSPVNTSKYNGLTIALDTVGTSNAQTIIDFMKQWHYNALRIYVGWCASFWSGNLANPMNSATQTFVDNLCRLCAENGFYVVCAISDQCTPWKTYAPEEIQVGVGGAKNSQGNWVCLTGPKFQTFSKNLATTLVTIMEKYATPILSVDEIVFVTGGGTPTFYSTSMQNAYLEATGKSVPTFSSTSGSYNTEQREFINFAKQKIQDFYVMIRDTAKTKNPNTIYQALIDTYWVYPKTSYDTEPWEYYGSSDFDELTYEWFYAIQNSNWNGITDGLNRIKTLNPNVKLFFIYGTSTMTTVANMRQSVQLTMDADYDGVFLYEYAKTKNNPFDVSDIVFA
jgi:hypothetical protein